MKNQQNTDTCYVFSQTTLDQAIQEWIEDISSGKSRRSSRPKAKLKVAHRSTLISSKKPDTSPAPKAAKSNTSVDKILDKIKEQDQLQ